jgi:hypothetical protein
MLPLVSIYDQLLSSFGCSDGRKSVAKSCWRGQGDHDVTKPMFAPSTLATSVYRVSALHYVKTLGAGQLIVVNLFLSSYVHNHDVVFQPN